MDERVEKIIALLQKHFGCSVNDILGKCRKQQYVDARTALYHTLYATGIMDGVQLGKLFGYTSSNSYYHLRKYEDLKTNKVFALTLRNFEKDVNEVLGHEQQ